MSRREDLALADSNASGGEQVELPRGVWRRLPHCDQSEESKKAWRKRLSRVRKVSMRISNRLPHFEDVRSVEFFRTPYSMPAAINAVERTTEWVSITSYSYDHPVLHAVLLRLLAQGKRVRFFQSRCYWYKAGIAMCARLLDLFNAGAEMRFWKGRNRVNCLHLKSIVICLLYTSPSPRDRG